MPREAEPSLSERTFVQQAIAEGLRLDNRKPDEYRPLELSFGHEYGVAEVKLGKTRILAKVSAEVTVPFSDRPFEGVFTITSELGPMVAPSFEVNRPTEAETLLSRLLEKTIRRSGALDTESLCLVAGQKCWAVRVDLHVLSADGGLTDAACLAAVAALRHFRRPDTSMDGEALTVYTPAEREPVPLGWLHSPFCVTFSFFGGGGGGGGAEGGQGDKGGREGQGMIGYGQTRVLLDTTWLEEQLRTASCTYSLNKHGELCQISKLGGAPVDAVLFVECAQTALAKAKGFADVVDRELAADAKRRDKGGLIAELLSAENAR